MIAGSGTISDYGQFISNCTLRQRAYKIPVNSLADVQLFTDIGENKPSLVEYQLIDTCTGAVENITPASYVIGQKSDLNWYGVFKEFSGASPKCFVVMIRFDETDIFFSEEFCIEECRELTLIEGCYGNLNNDISTDCKGVYFGTHAGSEDPLGDTSVKYYHKLLLRDVEVSLSSIKNSFKQGRTRTFRTEKENIYQFLAELVPEWFLKYVDAVFYRGEVKVDGTLWLVNDTQFEKVEDCLRQWKPNATFKESCYQSFSCEADACAPPPEACCDPVVESATVTEIFPESGDFMTIIIQCFVDSTPIVSGTSNPVTGLTDGSTVVSLDDFAGVRVEITRGGFEIPVNAVPPDGSNYATKVLADDFITFSSPLTNEEFIKIKTIPI